MTIATDIAHLKMMIAKGDRLAKEGYPTQGMNELNRMLLAELEGMNDKRQSN